MAARSRSAQLRNSHSGGSEQETIYPFPTGAKYCAFEMVDDTGDKLEILHIYYAGVPSTNFTEAPIGSLFFDLTATTGLTYRKVDTSDTWSELGDIT